MAEMVWSRFDLRLLTTLQALLHEQSVTRAARRLRRTQPAVSRHLAKLRRELRDPLLVRGTRGLQLTPRARVLAPRLDAALGELQAAFLEGAEFDPRRCTRAFRLCTADYVLLTLVPSVVETLAREAPGVTLQVDPMPSSLADALDMVDVAIMPKRAASAGTVWAPLWKEPFVCVARPGTFPAKTTRLTVDQVCAVGHLFVAPVGQRSSVVDDELARRGRQRRVALTTPSFAAVPDLVARTGLVAIVPRGLATSSKQLRAFELPFALPPITVELAWHERLRRDPEHVWFRRLVTRLATHFARP